MVMHSNNESHEGKIYLKILEKIRTGEYSPGYSLKEKEICEEFEVSRTPVRSALKRLNYDGMVDIVPRIGAQVRRVTPEEANELLLFREVIDGLAARLAAQKIDEEQSRELDNIYMKMKESIETNKLLDYIKYNDKLHCKIAEISNNHKILSTIKNISIRLMRVQYQEVLLNMHAQRSLDEHKKMIDFIKSGESEKAEKVARDHVVRVIDTVNILRNKGLYYF